MSLGSGRRASCGRGSSGGLRASWRGARRASGSAPAGASGRGGGSLRRGGAGIRRRFRAATSARRRRCPSGARGSGGRRPAGRSRSGSSPAPKSSLRASSTAERAASFGVFARGFVAILSPRVRTQYNAGRHAGQERPDKRRYTGSGEDDASIVVRNTRSPGAAQVPRSDRLPGPNWPLLIAANPS